jgi:hypothetical protein
LHRGLIKGAAVRPDGHRDQDVTDIIGASTMRRRPEDRNRARRPPRPKVGVPDEMRRLALGRKIRTTRRAPLDDLAGKSHTAGQNGWVSLH